jgi:tRNA-dihydrouridine synthase
MAKILAATAQSRGLKTLWALIHRSLTKVRIARCIPVIANGDVPHGNETAKCYRELKTKPYTIGNRDKKIVAQVLFSI